MIAGRRIVLGVSGGVAAYKAGGHDGVVAFGGGSGLDLGKAIAFMAGQTRPVWDYEDIGDWWTRADASAIAPIVAVPTTAGTGSEVGRASILTNSVTHEKKIIFHPKILPSVVISDPELTVGMPAGQPHYGFQIIEGAIEVTSPARMSLRVSESSSAFREIRNLPSAPVATRTRPVFVITGRGGVPVLSSL